MTVRDWINSGVRTAVQVLVAALIGYFTNVGIAVDSAALETVLFALTSGVVAMALNALANKYPIVGRILSLGLASGAPTYSLPGAK